MTTHQIGSTGIGTTTGQSPSDDRRSRRLTAGAGLLLSLAIVGLGSNWWSSGRQSAAGDVPDAPGVSRQISGLHVIDAYLVPAGQSGTFTLVASFVTTSGGPDRLLNVSAGSGPPAEPTTTSSTAARGLAISASGLTKIGPEPGAHPVTVTLPQKATTPPPAGTLRPGTPGTLVSARFDFADRGPLTVQVPVWTSLSGPATAR
jgi:hypothetical protein